MCKTSDKNKKGYLDNSLLIFFIYNVNTDMFIEQGYKLRSSNPSGRSKNY